MTTGGGVGVRVVKEKEDGIVRRVLVLDESGDEVAVVTRFLSHLGDSGYSPNTLCAYAYDLRYLASFLDEHGVTWSEFRPSTAVSFLAYLRRLPSRRPAQRLGLTVATGQGRLLSRRRWRGCWPRCRVSSSGPSLPRSTPALTTRCCVGLIRPWAGFRIVISRSPVGPAANSRCAVRCACGCRCGCPVR